MLVRRISTRAAKVLPPPSPLESAPSRQAEKKRRPALKLAELIEHERPPLWRYVVGSFVLRVPVSSEEQMLFPEEMTLAVMKWRLANSPANRWTPVLELYIKYLAAMVDGIGGDSSQVPASLTWTPPLPREPGRGRPHERDLCGKVLEVVFDCHGSLEGFVLSDCCERRLIESRERAWQTWSFAPAGTISPCACGSVPRAAGSTA